MILEHNAHERGSGLGMSRGTKALLNPGMINKSDFTDSKIGIRGGQPAPLWADQLLHFHLRRTPLASAAPRRIARTNLCQCRLLRVGGSCTAGKGKSRRRIQDR